MAAKTGNAEHLVLEKALRGFSGDGVQEELVQA